VGGWDSRVFLLFWEEFSAKTMGISSRFAVCFWVRFLGVVSVHDREGEKKERKGEKMGRK
jgi:hypothetical protein